MKNFVAESCGWILGSFAKIDRCDRSRSLARASFGGGLLKRTLPVLIGSSLAVSLSVAMLCRWLGAIAVAAEPTLDADLQLPVPSDQNPEDQLPSATSSLANIRVSGRISRISVCFRATCAPADRDGV